MSGTVKESDSDGDGVIDFRQETTNRYDERGNLVESNYELDEVDGLSMQAIDQITARGPVREYRTPNADDGSSSHVMEFDHGARFEVIYDREGRPADYRAEGVRFDILAGHIIVSRASK